MDITGIIKLLKSVYAFILYGVMPIIPLLKLSHELLAYKENKKRKQENITIIENCLKNQFIKSEQIRTLCVESLEGFCFEKITGIREERSQRRAALINLHNKVSHLITWKTILNALPYLIIKNGDVLGIRELSKGDKFWNILFVSQFLLSSIFFFLFYLLGIFSVGHFKFIFSILLLLISFAFFFLAIFCLWLRSPFKAVQKLRKEFNDEDTKIAS